MSEPKPQQEPSMEEILASIRRIISEDGASPGAEAKPAAPAVAEPPKADVLELTEVVEETPEAEPEPAPVEEASPEQEIELRDEEPPPEQPEMRVVPPPPQAEPQPAPRQAIDSAGLIGPAAAAAATSALTSLVQAVDRGGTPIGHGNRTIEDLVKEVMRPMIKDWLDANLPRLVERLVRKEIERLSHNAEEG